MLDNAGLSSFGNQNVRIYKIYGDQWKNTEHLKNVQEMGLQICASHSDYVRPDRPGIVIHFIP